MHQHQLLLLSQVISLHRCLSTVRNRISPWILIMLSALQLTTANDTSSGVTTYLTPIPSQYTTGDEETGLKEDIGFVDYTEIETHRVEESKDKDFVALGDMLLQVDDYLERFSSIQSRKGINIKEKLWPRENGNPVVPYKFTDQNEHEIQVMTSGISHWEEHTCLRFRPITDADGGYVRFVRGEGCRSIIGRTGAPQNITLDKYCYYKGTVIHEIGHAIGFLHEQSRPDRDQSIRIVEKNIVPEMMFNFIKQNENKYSNYSTPYDFTSAMQYGPFGFSKNGGLTLRTTDPKFQGLLGKNRMLTHRDKLVANIMYGCIDDWLLKCNMTKETCLNDGYTGANCTCVCAPGSKGDKCQIVVGDYYGALLPKCSSIITQSRTILKSPNYPNEKTDTWCVYQVKAPENQIIRVEFRDFQLHAVGEQKGTRCQQSFLIFMEDKVPNSIDTILCGTDRKYPDVFKSKSNELVMYFHIGGVAPSVHMRGFYLFIKFVPSKALPLTINIISQTNGSTKTNSNITSDTEMYAVNSALGRIDIMAIICCMFFWLMKDFQFSFIKG